jgi:hypothetical protein
MYSISFFYGSNKIIFEEGSLKDIYTKFLDWLDENGYSFSGDIHNTFNRKILTQSEVNELSKNYHVGKGYHKNHFYNINGKGKFILYNDISVGKILPNILKMLENFGIDRKQITTEGFESVSKIKKFGEIEDNLEEDDSISTTTEPMKNKKYSTLEAVQIILKKNDNNPMTANEIWNEINKIGLDINFLKHTMISRIGHFSINSGHSNKSDTPLFKVVSRSPIKYVLLNTESEIIETDDEVLDSPLGKYWAVGIPGSSDYEEFLDSGIWYDGYGKVGDERNKNILDRVKVGDVILIKSSSTKGPGRTISFTKLKGIGIVTSKEDYYLFNVDWIDSDDLPKDFDGISYRKTIEPMRDDEMLKFAKSIIGEDPTSESDSEESYGPEIENKIEKYPAKDPNRVENPFIQSVCILGEPGVGKSLSTIQAIEKDANHEFYLSIPTDLSTSMLVQFVGGELKLNKISKMIIKAYENPETKYTVLIDEFHKPLTIKRVNDELLQAISTKRFGGRRFISSEIAQKYISKKLKRLGFDDKKYYSYHGNIEIPDNFGFIFLSSKPNIVVSNDDLYERMDIVYLTDFENRPDTIEKIQSSRISETSDKNKFKNIIKDTDDDNRDEKKSEILSLVNKTKLDKKIDISSTSNESFKNDIIKFDAWRKI